MSDQEQDDVNVERYNQLKREARNLLKEFKYKPALVKFQQMQEIHHSDKIDAKISKIQEHLLMESDSESDSDMIELSDGYQISREFYDKLYPYQKEGIDWMWSLHRMKKGGILADDMGMGKTVQVIAFLSGLFDMDTIKSVLIVMPVSLITNWEDEFNKWCPSLAVYSYHGSSVREKERNLLKAQRKQGVLLTSYGLLVTSADKLARCNGRPFKWDYMILDEGHKIKNPTKTTKAAHEIMARHRLVLTGTPVQNNLKELWALYDFCHQGALLGTLATFKVQYENPINTAREKDATAGEKKYGNKIAENLRKLIDPYFLRRTKAEYFNQNENADPNVKSISLPTKNEFILWVFLSDKQIDIYRRFLESEDVQRVLMSTKSPLVQLNILKKVCDHPRLFSRRCCAELDLETSYNEMAEDPNADAVSIDVDPQLLLEESGKMEALILLLENLKENGHRTLVFSMSRKILDIIEKILKVRKWRISRLDGTVTKLEDRQRRVQTFQNDSRIPLMLLTTQVGGVGLTITAADRVVIYDPCWNPASDAQAVDRAYRIGQTKPVVVYRFITCGTIEEKIYRRQIFKDSITRQVATKGVKNKDPHRYFTKSELRDLFLLDDPKSSQTQKQLHKLHAKNRRTTPDLDKHIEFLLSLKKHVFNISDHDLMFQGNIKEENPQPLSQIPDHMDDHYIQQRVQAAQEQIVKESRRVEEEYKTTGTYRTTYTTGLDRKKFGEKSVAPSAALGRPPSPLKDELADEEGPSAQVLKTEDQVIIDHLEQNFKDFGISPGSEKPKNVAKVVKIEKDESGASTSQQTEFKREKPDTPKKQVEFFQTPRNGTPLQASEPSDHNGSGSIVINDTFEGVVESEPSTSFFGGSARRKSFCTKPLRVESDDSEEEKMDGDSNHEDSDRVLYLSDSE